MTEHTTGRSVWRRAAAEPRVAGSDEPLHCGGPELTVEERYLLMRERRLARKAAKEREEEEAAAQEAARHPSRHRAADEEEDELKAAERFRNDRYAVKLLRQDDGAWGGDAAGSGVLG